MSNNAWLEVDREGLAKTLDGKPKAFVLFEAIQNAIDEKGVTTVDVSAERIPGSPFVLVQVTDDAPEGWSDLSHAYRMFAESKKKGDPTLRGRFNVGEKMILALARKAIITTTTGSLIFDSNGRRKNATKTERGSTLTVEVRMTDEELEEAVRLAQCVIPPDGIALTINGEERQAPAPLRTIEATLPTVIAGDDGVLRPTERKTTVSIHKPNIQARGTRFVYEMGIPVVEIECEWDIDIGQRVPLNVDRDNITPAYRRKILALVVNEMAREIQDAGAGWVQEAISSPDIQAPALESVLDKRFGEKRVMFDPSDPEANKRAVADGYTVVHGRSIGGDASANIRRFRAEGNDLLRPAGQVTPSAAGTWAAREAANPDAPVMDSVDPAAYSEPQKRAVAFIERIGHRILGLKFPVAIFPKYPMGVRMAASWSKASGLVSVLDALVLGGTERFSLYNPGMRGRWEDRDYLLHLVIHECAHHVCGDHLDERYYDALTDLGVKAAVLALEEPGLFTL